MTKILHISKYYLPFRGGVEGVVNSLAISSVENKYEARVLCASHIRGLPSYELKDGVEIHRLKTLATLASQPVAPGYVVSLRKHLKWADIVYVHTPNPLAEVSMLFFAPRTTKIFILHHCDIVKQKILRKFFYPFQYAFYKRALKIIVATKNHITYSNICCHFREKCEIIPFGFREKKNTLEVETQGEQDYGLFVGRLVSYKGLDVLIRSFKSVRGKLKVIGSGPLFAELEQLVRDLSLEDKIFILGQVSDEMLEQYYKNCLFLVLPSITEAENFGLVQVEAMSFQKPVIATKLKSGASTIVEDNVSGFLVEPGSPLQLAEKMQQLFDSPDMAKAMGEKGLQRFHDFYSYERMKCSHKRLVICSM